MSDNHGKVVWSELNTRDPGAAITFFETVLGLSSVRNEMPGGRVYHTLMKGEEMVAGVLDISAPEFEGAPASWLTYLGCDDVGAACERTQKAGGSVLRPAFEIPGVGKMAVIQDPTGAVVALMTPRS